VWWIVVLCVLAPLVIGAVISDRRRRRRESLGGPSDELNVEHRAALEAERLKNPPPSAW
jgi:hypothetical protein